MLDLNGRKLEDFWREAADARKYSMIYAFDGWQLNSENYDLSFEGDSVQVEPQTFQVIEFLIENRHRVVPRDALLEEVWKGRNVSDWAVSAAVRWVGCSLLNQMRLVGARS